VNLPNAITIGRIFLVPLLVVVLLTKFEGRLILGVRKELVGAAIFGLASLTDWLDGFLARRRGQVTGMDTRGNARVINAMVPLANMFGYVNTLRSMSQGRAQYTMHFDHYEQVPQAVADEVRAKMA